MLTLQRIWSFSSIQFTRNFNFFAYLLLENLNPQVLWIERRCRNNMIDDAREIFNSYFIEDYMPF